MSKVKTRKIVINTCYGGFGLSSEAIKRYFEIKGVDTTQNFYNTDIERDDPALIQVIEELGGAASDTYSKLKIVEIPADVEWQIEEYDGLEHVAEQKRTWR